MQYELYGGLSGVAFFLAYLGAETGEAEWTDLARRIVHTIRKLVGFTGIPQRAGAFSGLGGYIYLLTHVAALWQDGLFADEAAKLLSNLPPLVEADEQFDIVSGAAGLILVLLGLRDAAAHPLALEVARHCGDHLLRNARREGRGMAWANADVDPTPLTGFGHGSAGIAFALSRLAAATSVDAYRQASAEAVAFERGVFDPVTRDWPDLRSPAKSRPRIPGWCHGAAGIGAARARMLAARREPALLDEVEAAARATLRSGFGVTHSLCHGDLGNLDLLQVMALAGNGVRSSTVAQLSRRVLREIQAGGYKTGVAHGVDSMDLMRGAAGIGYGLLRLARPESVPSVLLLDPPCSRPNSAGLVAQHAAGAALARRRC